MNHVVTALPIVDWRFVAGPVERDYAEILVGLNGAASLAGVRFYEALLGLPPVPDAGPTQLVDVV